MTALSATMVAVTRADAQRRTVAGGAQDASSATADVYDGVVGHADATARWRGIIERSQL